MMRLGALLAIAIGLATEATATSRAAAEPADGERSLLTLELVLDSANEHFPLLQAARLEREARSQEALKAAGAFDTRLGFNGDFRPAGFYENFSGDTTVEQPTRFWGSRFYAGYRLAGGDFPSYEGGRQTDHGGEFRLGVELPLLRGRAIDRERAGLRRAELQLDSLDPELRLERVELARDASVAFWDWLAAGRTVEIAGDLLAVAEVRQSQIERRVARGDQARIDGVDNRRLVVERTALLRGAQRDFEQAAIRLSLFLRDETGFPVRAGRDRLPDLFPAESPTDRAVVDADLEFARREHPLLQQIAFQREQLALDVRLARNDLLPGLDLVVEGSRDVGASRRGIDEEGKISSDPRSSNEVKALLRLELPIQRREARGRVGVATIRLAQLERRERFTRERLVADALVAVEALEAAYEQTGQARENLELAEQLRAAEERKLRLGASNLIDVNIREVQAATAARRLVEAQQAYFRALANYEARIARPL
ncbi:MAG: TolC family protein [Myxococcota bacterium]|nr:TolC family protein [Myxococcota bacterium]